MMTEQKAWQTAKKRARELQRDFYIIYERGEGYKVADESYIEGYGWDFVIKGYVTPSGYCY